MAKGIVSTVDLAIPSNIDLKLLNAAAQTVDGIGAGDVVADFLRAAAALDSELASGQGRIGQLIAATTFPTDRNSLDYGYGTLTTEEDSEHADGPEPQKVTYDATMIKIYRRTSAINWTWQAFRRMTSAKVEDGIAASISALREFVRYAWLERIFKGQATAVTIGTGKGVGWVGAGSQNFIPPMFEGTPFTSDSHLSRVATNPAFGTLYNLLREHGYYSTPGAPVLLLHGPADTATVQAATLATNGADYLAGLQSFVQPGTAAYAEALPYAHGVLKQSGVLCCEVGGIPTGFYAMVKSFGLNSTANPLARFIGLGDAAEKTLMRELDAAPKLNSSPLRDAFLYKELGFGISNPAAGAVQKIAASGNYADPTIT